MSGRGSRVAIHYRRPPDRETVFRQRVVRSDPGCVVTYLEHAAVPRPVEVGGSAVLEPGAPIVWFTFPGEWHDIGRFHLRDGSFTGYYANVLTPVEMRGSSWYTTDLFLDVWMDVDEGVRVLDEDELEAAAEAGWVDEQAVARARQEAERLTRLARRGAWPPTVAREWTLERVRRTLHRNDETPTGSSRA